MAASGDVRDRGRGLIAQWVLDSSECSDSEALAAAEDLIKRLWCAEVVMMIRADLDNFIAGIIESYENPPEEE